MIALLAYEFVYGHWQSPFLVLGFRVCFSAVFSSFIRIKKPSYLEKRQLGYLLRPVAFRPCLAAGMALSSSNYMTDMSRKSKFLNTDTQIYTFTRKELIN